MANGPKLQSSAASTFLNMRITFDIFTLHQSQTKAREMLRQSRMVLSLSCRQRDIHHAAFAQLILLWCNF